MKHQRVRYMNHTITLQECANCDSLPGTFVFSTPLLVWEKAQYYSQAIGHAGLIAERHNQQYPFSRARVHWFMIMN